MEMMLELNEADIKNVLAHTFDRPIENVEISIDEHCTGYGPGEHIERSVSAKIRTEAKIKICR